MKDNRNKQAAQITEFSLAIKSQSCGKTYSEWVASIQSSLGLSDRSAKRKIARWRTLDILLSSGKALTINTSLLQQSTTATLTPVKASEPINTEEQETKLLERLLSKHYNLSLNDIQELSETKEELFKEELLAKAEELVTEELLQEEQLTEEPEGLILELQEPQGLVLDIPEQQLTEALVIPFDQPTAVKNFYEPTQPTQTYEDYLSFFKQCFKDAYKEEIQGRDVDRIFTTQFKQKAVRLTHELCTKIKPKLSLVVSHNQALNTQLIKYRIKSFIEMRYYDSKNKLRNSHESKKTVFHLLSTVCISESRYNQKIYSRYVRYFSYSPSDPDKKNYSKFKTFKSRPTAPLSYNF